MFSLLRKPGWGIENAHSKNNLKCAFKLNNMTCDLDFSIRYAPDGDIRIDRHLVVFQYLFDKTINGFIQVLNCRLITQFNGIHYTMLNMILQYDLACIVKSRYNR